MGCVVGRMLTHHGWSEYIRSPVGRGCVIDSPKTYVCSPAASMLYEVGKELRGGFFL